MGCGYRGPALTQSALRLRDSRDPVGEEATRPRTYLSTPQVATRWGLKDEDIIGVEGGGPGWDLKGLGVVGTGSPDLEQPRGGYRLQVVGPGGASL